MCKSIVQGGHAESTTHPLRNSALRSVILGQQDSPAGSAAIERPEQHRGPIKQINALLGKLVVGQRWGVRYRRTRSYAAALGSRSIRPSIFDVSLCCSCYLRTASNAASWRFTGLPTPWWRNVAVEVPHRPWPCSPSSSCRRSCSSCGRRCVIP